MRALLVATLCAAGCAVGWTVDAAKEDQLAYLDPDDQAHVAMAAKRTDGATTWLSVRDVERFGGRVDPDPGRLRVHRVRRRMLIGGAVLAAIGASLTIAGVAVVAIDLSSDC